MIRNERPSDITSIRRITEAAFRKMSYASGDEQDVIDRLRQANALPISLVALEGDSVLGHVAFSPATLNDEEGHWFALGPVSVSPERQAQGIGSRLIRAGLEQLEAAGARGCILTGNPNYYSRFGFLSAPEHCPDGEPAAAFMVKKYIPELVVGKFAFHGAFYGCA